MKYKMRVDGVEFEIDADPSFVQACEKRDAQHKKEMLEAQANADREKGRADAVEKERDEQKVKLDSVDIDAAVNSRLELRSRAQGVLGAEYNFDGKSDRDIMIETIKKNDSTWDPKDLSDDYIKGRFDNTVKVRKIDAAQNLGANVIAVTHSDGESPLDKAYTEYNQRCDSAWKTTNSYNSRRAG
jgi:hypothetical protein